MRFLTATIFLSFLFITSTAHADILLGVAGPFTGAEAGLGDRLREGADVAIADINAAAGILGQKLALFEGDDQCDPKQAVTVANAFIEKNVKGVIGYGCSAAAIPASQTLAEENIIMIAAASSNPLITDAGNKNVFRIYGRDDQAAKVAAAYIARHFKDKRIALVDDKEAYGQGLAAEIRKDLAASGIKIILNDQINRGEKDFLALTTKLKENNIELLFYAGFQNEAGLIMRQMRQQNLDTVMMGGDPLSLPEYGQITGPLSEGTLTVVITDPTENPHNQAILASFAQKGIAPNIWAFYNYAAVQVLTEAMTKAGSTEPDKIETALHTNTFDTVLGDVSFDAKGDIKSSGYQIYAWQNGKYQYVPQ